MKENLLNRRNGQLCAMGIGRKFALHRANHSMNSGCAPCGGKNVELLSAVALDCLWIWRECVCVCVAGLCHRHCHRADLVSWEMIFSLIFSQTLHWTGSVLEQKGVNDGSH